jgi:hypothetical protein
VKKQIFVFTFLVFLSGISFAFADQIFSNEKEAITFAEKIINDYVNKDQNEALRTLPRFATVKTEDEQQDRIRKLVKFNTESTDRRGAPIGFKQISSKTIGGAVMQIRYLVSLQKSPLVWDFYFYRSSNNDKWKFNDLVLSNSVQYLFLQNNQ